MKTPRDWFIFGLLLCVLLAGGTYLLLPAHKSAIVAPDSPPAAAGASPAQTAGVASQPGSVPAPAYHYNARGQLQAILYPDGSTYSYVYDAYGNKIRETSRSGNTWTYAYDQNHRPVTVVDPKGHVTFKAASSGTSNAN